MASLPVTNNGSARMKHAIKEWFGVEFWNDETLKLFFLPCGVLLLATAVLLHSGLIPIPDSAINFFYAATFGAGLILAWRFHSSRVLFALLTLLLAERALVFFSSGLPISNPTARGALETVAILVPLNFVLLSLLRERGFTAPAVGFRLLLLFVQSVFVALMCRPDHAAGTHLLNLALLNRKWFSWSRIPQLGLLFFAAALCVIAIRFLRFRKPVESGFFWSLLAVFTALQLGGRTRFASGYLATAGLLLLASVVETSYLMAYHDELTGLPARRAFNDAIAGLEQRYAIAIVDIDHFKMFNDTYGHETGDQVLRMVASRLAAVSGGGKSFRCGGEEFSIVFPGKSAKDALEHLEVLRVTIQHSDFRVRTRVDRRTSIRGGDRRTCRRKKNGNSRLVAPEGRTVSVTVSIGVAEPSTRNHDIEQVIRAADKALYRAKEGGRNRVEMDGLSREKSAVGSKRRT